MNVLVIIPTYNEAENIADLIPAIQEQFAAIPDDCSILVVDDLSPDGTADVVKSMQGKYKNLYLMEHGEKAGLAAAYLAGFQWAMDKDNPAGKHFDACIEMDADFSHKPEYLPTMINLGHSHDAVIASRNIKGGGVEGWSALRNFISKGGSLYSRLVIGVPIYDLTGGFNFWSRKALDAIGLEKIISRGYCFQVEMKARAYKKGLKYVEFPIIFPDRTKGESKMDKKIIIEAMMNVWKLRNVGND